MAVATDKYVACDGHGYSIWASEKKKNKAENEN